MTAESLRPDKETVAEYYAHAKRIEAGVPHAAMQEVSGLGDKAYWTGEVPGAVTQGTLGVMAKDVYAEVDFTSMDSVRPSDLLDRARTIAGKALNRVQ